MGGQPRIPDFALAITTGIAGNAAATLCHTLLSLAAALALADAIALILLMVVFNQRASSVSYVGWVSL